MTTNEPSAPKTGRVAGILPFEADRYMAFVEDCDMTAAQKEAFLRTLWDIMSTFVRWGFDMESTLPALFEKASESPTDALEQVIPTHEFNVAGTDSADKEE